MQVIFHILTILMAAASAVLLTFSLATPAWTTQSYEHPEVNGTAMQGFGLFQFHSDPPLSILNWALSVNNTISYSDFCKVQNLDPKVEKAVCGTMVKLAAALYVIAAAVAAVVLVCAIVAACRPMPGWPERIINWFTFLAGLLIVGVLMIWALSIQDNLLNSQLLNPEYSACKGGKVVPGWKCWFYGYCYWIGLAAAVALALTGSMSSCAVSQKYKKASRAEEEAIAAAVMASTVGEGRPVEQGTSYQAYPPVGPNNGRLLYGFRSHLRLHAVLSSLSYQSSLYPPMYHP